MRALLSYFSLTLRRNDLDKISLVEVWNPRGVCQHMACPLQVQCSGF